MTTRSIENPTGFLVKAGFTYHSAYNLLNESSKGVKLKHIEMLCTTLKCSIEDLFGWSPDKNILNEEKHPLYKIKDRQSKGNIKKALTGLSLEKLEALQNYIGKLNEESAD